MLEGDNEQQQRLEQALLTPDTEGILQRGGAMSWQQRIDRALDERRAAEAFRRRLPVTHGAGRWLEREGERWLNFSSNDYLGLSQHPAIIAARQQGATRYGVGAGGSGPRERL